MAQPLSAQSLADILPTAIAIVSASDEAVFRNRAFQRIQAGSGSSVFNTWSESIHPDDRDAVASRYRHTLASNDSLRTEYRSHGEGQSWRALVLDPLAQEDAQRFLSTLEPSIQDEEQDKEQDTLFICTITDITPYKAAEVAQKEIAQQAQDRKEQQERFIDMISHEVRNPLSAVLHCTEDILEAVRDEHANSAALTRRVTEAANTISLCVGHQRKIIDDVLMFSKLDAAMLTLLPRAVQPTRHLRRSLTMFQPELRRRGIKFESRVDPSYVDAGVSWAMSDIHRMGQVLINLVSNAIKYTSPAAGRKSIRVSMAASTIRPSSYPPNVVYFKSTDAARRLDETDRPDWGQAEPAYIMVAVRDTGIGISDEHQKRLFERFNQVTPRTDRIYGGFGLGLNVSRKLCHLHGGEIGVSSKEGHGSTFGFFFRVRRCQEEPGSADPDEVIEHHTPIEELCRGIQDLGNEMTGVNQGTDTPPMFDTPPVMRVEELQQGGPRDERTRNTASIMRQVEQKQKQKHAQTVHSSGVDENQPPLVDCDPHRPRVLLVEDNIINQQIISRRLSMSGFDVTEAGNGQEALDAYRRACFDCILMDQQMPVMDGSTATRMLRAWEQETGRHTPVLGVTANVRQEHQAEMFEAGMDRIILKPYKLEDLCCMMNALITATKQIKVVSGIRA